MAALWALLLPQTLQPEKPKGVQHHQEGCQCRGP
jgi:hypothetical protein